MKDCKWTPATACTKGQHFGRDGVLKDRTAVGTTPDGERMMKFLDESGNRKSRRTAERQVQRWMQDGSWEKLLSGELEPPAGWALHIRDTALDKATIDAQGIAGLFPQGYKYGLAHLGSNADEFLAAAISLQRQDRLRDPVLPVTRLSGSVLYTQVQELTESPAERVLLAHHAGTAGIALLKSMDRQDPLFKSTVALFTRHGLTEDTFALVNRSRLLTQLAVSDTPASDIDTLRALVSMDEHTGDRYVNGGVLRLTGDLDRLRKLESLVDRRAYLLTVSAEGGFASFDDNFETVKQGLKSGALTSTFTGRDVASYLRDPSRYATNTPRIGILVDGSGWDGQTIWPDRVSVGTLDLRHGITRMEPADFDTLIVPENPSVEVLAFAAASSLARAKGELSNAETTRLKNIQETGSRLFGITAKVVENEGEITEDVYMAICLNNLQHRSDTTTGVVSFVYDLTHYVQTGEVFRPDRNSVALAVAENLACELTGEAVRPREPSENDQLIAELTAKARARHGRAFGVTAVPYYSETRDWDHVPVKEVRVALSPGAEPHELARFLQEDERLKGLNLSVDLYEVAVSARGHDTQQLLERLQEACHDYNRSVRASNQRPLSAELTDEEHWFERQQANARRQDTVERRRDGRG